MKNKKDFVIALLLLSAVIACLLIWPGNAIKNTTVSGGTTQAGQLTGALAEDVVAAQTFVPQYDYIRNIGLLLDLDEGKTFMGDFLLDIYDAGGNHQRQVFSKIHTLQDRRDGYQNFRVNLKVIPGATYILQLSVRYNEDQPLCLAYDTKAEMALPENQLLYYNGTELTDASLACTYSYGSPLGKGQIAVYDLGIILLCMLCCAVIRKVTARYEKWQQPLDPGFVIRSMATTGFAWLLVYAVYYFFVKRAFGGTAWDLGCYGVALLLMTIMGMYIIWQCRMPRKLPEWKKVIPQLIRVIAFAFYFTLYAPYFNSGTNYGHYLNGAYMNLAFAIVILTFFGRRQIFAWKNLIFSIAYWGVCGFWFLRNLPGMNREQAVLYEWEFLAGWFWGIVIVLTICNLCRKQVQRMSLSYALLITAFFALTWIFRYQKYWPITMAVFFGLLYLQKLDQQEMLVLVRNFCQGALCSFWYVVIFCLLHRPYHNYNFARYPLHFSSVAMAGLYLLFVFTAVILLALERYQQDRSLKSMWFYYLSLGTVMSYMFISVSRTAILASAVVALLAVVGYARTRGKGVVKRTLQMIGMLLLCFCLLLPVTYTLTRCVPAVVDDPVLYPYEEFDNRIYQGEEKDSYRYMNVKHLLELSTGRFMVMLEGQVDRESIEDKTQTGQTAGADTTTQEDTNDSSTESTNGRLAIFKMYLGNLNLTGHESMIITVGDTIYAHAHNTFIQYFYDHGIISGIVFLLVGFFTLIRSFLYGKQGRDQSMLAMAPLLYLVSFAIAGMTEWVFQPVIPLGFGVLFMIYPLLSPIKKQSQE